MAQEVQIEDTNSTAKIRNVLAPALLPIITLGIYLIFWWYYINKEMVELGRAKGTSELGDNPAKSTLALFPGGLIIVPAIWTMVTTFQRIQSAQRLTGREPINGWIGLVLWIVIQPAFYAYMQSGLNNVWRTQAHTATPPMTPAAPATPAPPAPSGDEQAAG